MGVPFYPSMQVDERLKHLRIRAVGGPFHIGTSHGKYWFGYGTGTYFFDDLAGACKHLVFLYTRTQYSAIHL